MMAADYRHIGGRENRLGRHYSRFSAFWPAPALAGQSLALRKLCDAGSNRRSRARVTHGMAFRYRLMPDGKRQILTFMIPGDIFGLHAFLLKAMDHCIATLVPTRIAPIARDTVFDLF